MKSVKCVSAAKCVHILHCVYLRSSFLILFTDHLLVGNESLEVTTLGTVTYTDNVTDYQFNYTEPYSNSSLDIWPGKSL